MVTKIDAVQTARALLLVAGALCDEIEHGHLQIIVEDDGHVIKAGIHIVDGLTHPNSTLFKAANWATALEGTKAGSTLLPMRLLQSLVELQGGQIEVDQDREWARLTLCCPTAST